MPSLVAFGRNWNIGSDDFVFPEITEAVVRLSWVAFGVSVFVFHFPLSCSSHNLTPYVLALLVINVVTILLAIITAVVSARGTIMDANPRRHVSTLIYIRVPILLAEVVWAVISTVHAFRTPSVDEGCHYSTLVRITMLLEWALIAAVVIGLFAVFHLTENDVEDGTIIAHRSWSRRFRIFKIGQDNLMRAALDDVALLISSFFVDTDLVLSDVVAGLLLTYHSPNNAYPPVQLKSAEERPSWMCLEEAEYYLHYATSVYGWPTYLLYNFGATGFWRLAKRLQCCGRMRCQQKERTRKSRVDSSEMKDLGAKKEEKSEVGDVGRYSKASQGRAMVVEDNCCYCNTAAVVLSTEKRNIDLAFMSFRNRLYEIPFAVLSDHDKKAIVVSIRGSCSLIDLVTDLCLEDEAMTVDVDSDDTLREDDQLDKRGEVRVHRGMLRSARYVFETLLKHKVLEDLSVVNPSYQLVVCGHSLGAGVGSLLTMLLKQQYPSIRCFAYAPPGCVISEFGQDEMARHVMSVVSGDDIVSRISYQALHRLREKVFNELTSCKRAKHQILIRGVYQLFFEYPWQESQLNGASSTDLHASLLRPSSPTNSYGGTADSVNAVDVEQQPEGVNVSPPTTRERIQLYCPGQIVYLSENDGDVSEDWIDPKCLNDVKLSVSAMSDHMPAAVAKLIERAQHSTEGAESVGIVNAQPI